MLLLFRRLNAFRVPQQVNKSDRLITSKELEEILNHKYRQRLHTRGQDYEGKKLSQTSLYRLKRLIYTQTTKVAKPSSSATATKAAVIPKGAPAGGQVRLVPEASAFVSTQQAVGVRF